MSMRDKTKFHSVSFASVVCSFLISVLHPDTFRDFFWRIVLDIFNLPVLKHKGDMKWERFWEISPQRIKSALLVMFQTVGCNCLKKKNKTTKQNKCFTSILWCTEEWWISCLGLWFEELHHFFKTKTESSRKEKKHLSVKIYLETINLDSCSQWKKDKQQYKNSYLCPQRSKK